MQLSSLKNQSLVLLKNKTALNYNTGANTFQNIRFKLFFLFGTADALAVVTVFKKREQLIARCYPPSLMVFLHIQYFLHFESFSLKQNIAFAGGEEPPSPFQPKVHKMCSNLFCAGKFSYVSTKF